MGMAITGTAGVAAGVTGIAGAVATHFIAKHFEKDASFCREVQEHLLKNCARISHDGVANETNMENIVMYKLDDDLDDYSGSMIQNERMQPQAPAHSAQPHQPQPMPMAATEPPQVAQVQSTPSLLDVLSTPILEDIFWLVGTQVTAKWKSVAICLGIEACVIDIISTNCPKNCEEACIDMLQRWLAIDNHTREKERT